jgi:hypothetical protein
MDGYVAVETPLASAEDDGVFTVTRFGLSEDTVYSRALHYTPTRYSAADLDSVAARAARGGSGGMIPVVMGGGGTRPPPDDSEPIARRLRAAMKFPDFKLPIDQVWVAQDESVWVRRADPSGETVRWVLLDPRGEPRGELELPSRSRPLWSRGDLLWAGVPDEDDVPWLVRYTIERGR